MVRDLELKVHEVDIFGCEDVCAVVAVAWRALRCFCAPCFDCGGGESPLAAYSPMSRRRLQAGGRKLDCQPVRVSSAGRAEHHRHRRPGVIGPSARQLDRQVEWLRPGFIDIRLPVPTAKPADSRVGALLRSMAVAAAPTGLARPGAWNAWLGRVATSSRSQWVNAAAASRPGPRQQPVAGHPLGQRGGHHGACLVGVVAEERQICRQRVGRRSVATGP